MCTAINYQGKDRYFGRNLDLEFHYEEAVVITPRAYRFPFEKASGYALIGIATVADNYPLYYDASNEMGLAMAGLDFVDNAYYAKGKPSKRCIAPYELISWVLRQFACVSEAVTALKQIKIGDIPFSDSFPQASLHWMLSDGKEAVTIEQTKQGLHLYNNPVGVLTNNPPFPYQMTNLANYMHLDTQSPKNTLCPNVKLQEYSRGMGAMGLPGDLSSASRFVRAVFTKQNSLQFQEEGQAVGQFFHILKSVAQTAGCVKVKENFKKTVYSSCCNLDKCIYYYTTYENSQITAVHLYHEDLESSELIPYPLTYTQHIRMEN